MVKDYGKMNRQIQSSHFILFALHFHNNYVGDVLCEHSKAPKWNAKLWL